MKIERKRHLQRLINSRKNGQIKIITGIRRCGKSYLLNVLYREYLQQEGTKPEQIIAIELDNDAAIRLRNPLELSAYLRQAVQDTNTALNSNTFNIFHLYHLLKHNKNNTC